MIVNVKIRNELLGYPGTLGAIINLGDSEQYGLTCFHTVFSSVGTVNSMIDQEGSFSIRDGVDQGLIVGYATPFYDEQLDFALIKLSQEFISLIEEQSFIESFVIEEPLVGMDVVRFDAITGEKFYGVIESVDHEILIKPSSTAPISQAGDSGSIWLLKDFHEEVHQAIGLHRKKYYDTENRSAIPIQIIRSELSFDLYRPGQIS